MLKQGAVLGVKNFHTPFNFLHYSKSTGSVSLDPLTCTINSMNRYQKTPLIGKTVYTDTAKIGGVKFTCQKVYIGNTLNKTQMQTIKTNIETVKTTALRGVDAVNNIYAGLNTVQFDGTVNDVFNNTITVLGSFNHDGKYFKMIAPYLYAGYLSTELKISDGDRAKIILPHYLMTGDVVLLRDFDNNNLDKGYIFNGERLVDLTSTDIVTVEDTFNLLQLPYVKNRDITIVVLRPSLAI